MKIRSLVKTGPRGQIVIPKKMRDALQINEDTQLYIVLQEDGIFIEPIEEFMPKKMENISYLDILEKTKGSWAKDAKKIEKEEKERKSREIKEAKKIKKQW